AEPRPRRVGAHQPRPLGLRRQHLRGRAPARHPPPLAAAEAAEVPAEQVAGRGAVAGGRGWSRVDERRSARTSTDLVALRRRPAMWGRERHLHRGSPILVPMATRDEMGGGGPRALDEVELARIWGGGNKQRARQ